ncbi:MAG TPA: hypothetical protein VFA78_03700 [Chloroflexota bacterium]|nr:hypothetical protein [Chloroflexota bacterium]
MIAVTAQHNLILFLHQRFAFVVVTYCLIVGLWGLGLFLIGRQPVGGFLGALVLAEGVGILQDIIGLILLATGKRPHDLLHLLYGVVIVLTLPFVWSISDRGTTRRDSLYLGLAMIFLVGIALRAITTAGP